jgi:selenocysteine lyase/cysteine desulfurase
MPRLVPEKFEAGTLATPAIVTLGAGIEFINGIGLNAIREHCELLANEIKSTLIEQDKIILYDSYGGIVLFNVIGTDSFTFTEMLNQSRICTRGGLHCAPMAHRQLSTSETGAVRISLSYFNSEKDVDCFAKTIRKILAE